MAQSLAEIRAHVNQLRRGYREFVRQQKAGRHCRACGEEDVLKLGFHHRDPATKLFNIGQVGRNAQTVLEEIAKCDVLCKACHCRLHKTKNKHAMD